MRDPCDLHDPEVALAMRAALAPPFMTLRRILVQLCGLMLLSRGRRSETHDGIAVTLAALKAEAASVLDALRAAEASLPPHLARVRPLLAAASDVAAAMRAMERALTAFGKGLGQSEAALALLRRAQRRLAAVSDDRAGMGMVSFSHACCCASIPRTAPLSCR